MIAVKNEELHACFMFGASFFEEAAREAEALSSFCLPNVAQLHAAFLFEGAAVLVVEYAGEALSKLALPPPAAKALFELPDSM